MEVYDTQTLRLQRLNIGALVFFTALPKGLGKRIVPIWFLQQTCRHAQIQTGAVSTPEKGRQVRGCQLEGVSFESHNSSRPLLPHCGQER